MSDINTDSTKLEICEVCPNLGALNDFTLNGKPSRLCDSCLKTEQAREKEIIANAMQHQTPELQEKRLEEHNIVQDLIQQAKKMDESINLSTDLFNAKTVAIMDIKAVIDADNNLSVDQKNFKLAEVLMGRFNHYQSVIFDARKTLGDAFASQKAIQIYMNDLSNKLRAEERERLKIADIHYTAKMPKPVAPKAIKTTKAKASKEEIRKVCAELGIAEYTLALVMTSKNWDLDTAANHFRRTIAEAKSMSQSKEN